ncbi:MAG: tetratricopeptide repeat protein [Luteolibacter sp.]
MEKLLFRCFTVIAVALLVSLTPTHAQAWKSIPAKDIPALKASAEKGDPAAKADYAYHSLICLGDVPYNQNLIFRYFSESAEKGNIDGIAGLSHCYQFSIGTVMDREKAGALAEKASKAGHPIGTKIIASLAVTAGKYGGERDWDKWVKLCKESAETGCTSARYNMALIYMDGIDGEPDLEEGVRRLRELHDARSFPLATTWLLNHLGHIPIDERDSDLYRECYDLTHHYADLGEPDALYTLGRCHQRAGDEQTAMAYFFEAAHRGSRKSWELLWHFRNPRDNSVGFRSTLRDMGNLGKRAYQTGSRLPRVVSQAGEEYMRHFKRPETQALMPILEQDLLRSLATGNCNAHDVLGMLYERADPKLSPKISRPDLAIAHLTFHSNHGSGALSAMASSLAFPLYGRKASDEDIARAMVAGEKAGKKGSSKWKGPWWQSLQKKVTPAIRKRYQELKADGYPDSDEYREEAKKILIAEGHLE